MKKVLVIGMLFVLFCAAFPAQSQAGTCTCKLPLSDILFGWLFPSEVGCGDGSRGGNKGQVDSNLTDAEVIGKYINQSQTAIADYNNNRDGWDWQKSGWSCHK
ncbi:MAG: hypothetical protein M0009_14240 [Deltaproteobacteria bacterium]|nr:hypothetical protein [Deltaproteobacteria bacterium]